MNRQDRGPLRWKQRECTRAVKALEAAGLNVERIEVTTDGNISVYPAPRAQKKQNDADEIIGKLR